MKTKIQMTPGPLLSRVGPGDEARTVPVSRARTLSFQKNRHFTFHALVASTETFGIALTVE